MSYCAKCGGENSDGDKFCHSCGTQLATRDPAEPMIDGKNQITPCDIIEYFEVFPHPNNPIKGWVRLRTGVCIKTDEKTWSETHVSSSGGGGYVHPQYGGNVSAAQVSSTVTTRREQKLWVRFFNDQSEADFSFSNDSTLSIMEGQPVLVCHIGLEGESGPLCNVTNIATKKYIYFSCDKEIFKRANKKVRASLDQNRKRICKYFSDIDPSFPVSNWSEHLVISLISFIVLFTLALVSSSSGLAWLSGIAFVALVFSFFATATSINKRANAAYADIKDNIKSRAKSAVSVAAKKAKLSISSIEI